MNYLMNRVLTSPASLINLASLFSRKSTVRILAIPALASFVLLAAATLAPAQSSAPLDKHARRIEKRLTKYRQGTFLDFQFRDSSQTFGSLGPLSAASFQFTDADSNKTQTHYYSELVARDERKRVHWRGLGAAASHPPPGARHHWRRSRSGRHRCLRNPALIQQIDLQP